MDLPTKIKEIETRAHINVALIKYWGKKNEALKIPFQSSISFTLDKFYTETKIKESLVKKDFLTINNQKASKDEYKRIVQYLNRFRKMYGVNKYFEINSVNNVYKKAGLASSASAFASIAYGLNLLCELNLKDEDVSKLARLGSGSACRSIYPGFVKWDKGDSHESSYATQLDIDYSKYVMAVVILSKEEKKISSTTAMKKSVKNVFYQEYLQQSESSFLKMLKALKENDLHKIGSIMQENSNLMHKLINYTKINYYVSQTYEVIELIEALQKNNYPFYYTIDAGANVKILTEDKYVEILLDKLKKYEVIVCKGGPGAYVKSTN